MVSNISLIQRPFPQHLQHEGGHSQVADKEKKMRKSSEIKKQLKKKEHLLYFTNRSREKNSSDLKQARSVWSKKILHVGSVLQLQRT